MIASRLQQAVDGAWASLERALEKGTTESDEAKALAALKKTFVARPLGAMETHVSTPGRWARTGSRRTYEPGKPKGLVELAVSHSASVEALEAVATAAAAPAATGAGKDAAEAKENQPASASEDGKDGAKQNTQAVQSGQTDSASEATVAADPDPVATKPFKELGEQAVAEQLDYMLDTLLEGDHEESEAAGLHDSIAATRAQFGAAFEVAPLVAVVGTDVAAGLDATQETRVKRLLAGGELIAVADRRLKGHVLVFPCHPDGTYWYSAVEFKSWWEPDGAQAKVKVVSRVLLDVPDGFDKRYLRPVTGS